ncbi:MAG: lipopolysaccharide heptosyltransferase I [Gammaproteobacteria bacterium]
MTRVLLVKMSSLGDVVHALPAVTDAARRGFTFDWVVEEAFAAIPALHPSVTTVLPIAWRRWRSGLWSARHALDDFRRRLRSRRYEVVLDAQGLIKSAVVTALARGEIRAGFAPGSARERQATLAYGRRVSAAVDRHAVHRQRVLFAGALGYPLPEDAPEFGLDPARLLSQVDGEADPILNAPQDLPECVLLHGTTWASKHYPDAFWMALGDQARAAGFAVGLPAGSAAEAARAARIAAAVGASAWPRSGLAALLPRLARARLVIGVDSGLLHLAAALGRPALGLYGSTDSVRTGCLGARALALQADFPCAPCGARVCGYRGRPIAAAISPAASSTRAAASATLAAASAASTDAGSWPVEIQPPCFASLPPALVWSRAAQLLAQTA